MTLKEKMVLRVAPVAGVVAAAAAPFAVHAQDDWTASTTAAVQAGQNSIINMFFTLLPYILGGVVAVTLTLWGISWVLGMFRRGRHK